jgi:hypothetical protein
VVSVIENDTLYGEYNLKAEVVSRWLSPDPLAAKYPNWSPYNFSLNNPVNVIDPDGRDVILVIWATHDGNIGHAGVAVANYREVKERVKENGKWVTQTRMEHDGTYTYRDLWPGNEGGVGKSNYDKDVEASYNTKTVTLDDLKNTDVTGSEGRAADGVLQLTTDFATDQGVTAALDEFQSANPKYNGLNCNCSDFAEQGVESAAGQQLGVDEKLSDTKSATTPNQLWKATVGLPNASIVKDPGDKVKPNFVDGVTGGGKSADKARKKN